MTEQGAVNPKSGMANCSIPFNNRHSTRTSLAPWTNGLVEAGNKNHGTHLKMFLHDTPRNWSIQVHFFAYARVTQPLLHLQNSRYEMVFHSQLHIPMNFQLCLSRNSFRECTAE